MRQIVECIPNFSEGRNADTVRALVGAVTSVADVRVLDQTMDPDHHRAVLSFVGPPEAVGEAAFRTVETAASLIDLRRHEGAHPRVGAADVVPFVPVRGVTMQDCVQLAKRVGQRVGAELGIPVFLYGQAATRPEHEPLEAIRRGGLEGLAFRMESDPHWLPDFGPPHPHHSAGVVIIGARQPLIAFNVNLNAKDVTVAKTIARTVRHSGGGLPCVKAIGVELASRGLVQVAMNLTDYRVTSMHAAFQAVKSEAAKYGVGVVGSELIGLVPQAALDETAAASLQFERFDPSQVLETRIAAALAEDVEGQPSLAGFLEAVQAAAPTPAGGSVAALVGALAASLGVMGARLGQRSDAERHLLQLSRQLHQLVYDDVAAYDGLAAACKRPKHHSDRLNAISVVLQKATEVPLEIAESACEAGRSIHACLASAKPGVHSDLTVGMMMAVAAAEAALHTVNANLKRQPNQELTEMLRPRIEKVAGSLEELKGLCYTSPPSR
jgi:glutamate formiminotransferase/formiminotetrahydrofolate cyclodeaminase